MKPIQRILYVWRLLAKVISYASFGGASALFSCLFPIIFVISGFNKERFKKISRAINLRWFKLFVWEMTVLGILKLRVDHAERIKDIHSCVVVANHPSLLDVVMLFSIVPNVNCIVKGSLGKTPFIHNVVNTLFIPNSLSFEEQMARASEGMECGESLIIFPEGTRTRPGEPLQLKKGAARFALHGFHNVQPIYIGGNEKIGLRKHDKYFSFHPTERYHYNIDILEQIDTKKYSSHSEPAAVNLLTEELRETFESYRKNDPENPANLIRA